MSTNDSYGAATLFLQRAIQEWGHDPVVRIAAVQTVLDMAGFHANATCWPAFAGIWPKPCVGPDGEQATAWLKQLTDGLQLVRGDASDEIAYLKEAIDKRIMREEDGA